MTEAHQPPHIESFVKAEASKRISLLRDELTFGHQSPGTMFEATVRSPDGTLRKIQALGMSAEQRGTHLVWHCLYTPPRQLLPEQSQKMLPCESKFKAGKGL